MTKHERELRHALAKQGIEVLRFTPRGKHQLVEVRRGDQTQQHLVSASPSDWRATANEVARIKRQLPP